MNCPHCNTPMINTYVCSRCEQTNVLMRKIIFASNWHYNQGLEKIKVKDLTGAATSLLTSLKYNKFNTDARNLLGLIYYQTGEIVAALSEWVISVHLQKKGNIATTYIKAIQNNPGKLQQANKTIQKYNLALQYLEQSNTDMAIIELKKVVNLSPNYISAYQLLGLLYIKTKQFAAARKVLVRSLRVDRNNTTSLRYLEELAKIAGDKVRTRSRKRDGFSQINDPNPVVIEEKAAGRYTDFNTGLLSFVNVIIGIIIGAAVVWLLLVPSIQKTEAEKYNRVVVEYSEKISDKNSEISSLTKQIENLKTEKEALQSQLDVYASATDEGSNDLLLLQAAKEFILGNQSEAGAILANVESDKLDSQEAKDIYEHILGETKEQTINSLYQNGFNAYEGGNYSEAETYFTKVLRLDNGNENAIYYLASSYEKLDDLTNAAIYYKRIVDEFPSGEWFDVSTQALENME